MENANNRKLSPSSTALSRNCNKEVDNLVLKKLDTVRMLVPGFGQGCRLGCGLGIRCRLSPVSFASFLVIVPEGAFCTSCARTF